MVDVCAESQLDTAALGYNVNLKFTVLSQNLGHLL
jgi:hypothetical protein